MLRHLLSSLLASLVLLVPGGVLSAADRAGGDANAPNVAPAAPDANAPAAPAPGAPATAPAGGAPADEVVVTATRLASPRREVASAVTVITADDIRRKGAVSVAEVLRDVPGVTVVRQGGLHGQVTSVFLRGAKSEHTKVLVDGVCVNDPIAPSGAFNWADLLPEDIERIEVVRGPQSVLYGSDAIGGVIQILTKRGKGKPGGYVKAWGGSHDTYGQSVGAGGAVKWLDYYASVTRVDSKGISAASWHDGNHERDGYANTSFTTKLGIAPTDNFETVILVKGLCAEAEVDDGGGPGMDDRQHENEARQWLVRIEPRLILLDGLWEQKFAFSHIRGDRQDSDDPAGDRVRSDFHGDRTKFEWQHDLHLHETNTLTFGAETEEEAGSSSYYSDAFGRYYDHFPRRSLRTSGWFVQDKVSLYDVFFATAGARVDYHDEFGRACTWRVAPALWIRQTQTKIKGALGTGFKAPTIYQLYVPLYGDPALSPEKSLGWEAGLEQYLCRKTVALEAVYFDNRFKNLIDFQAGRFGNVGRAHSRGVEFNATWQPVEPLKVTGTYTFLRTLDEETDDDLVRRPRQKFGVDVSYSPVRRLRLTAGVSFTGGRDDRYFDMTTFATRRVRLAKYALWNLGAEYDVTDRLTVFGRVENAFNEQYEEVFGYGTPGCGGYVGARVTF